MEATGLNPLDTSSRRSRRVVLALGAVEFFDFDLQLREGQQVVEEPSNLLLIASTAARPASYSRAAVPVSQSIADGTWRPWPGQP